MITIGGWIFIVLGGILILVLAACLASEIVSPIGQVFTILVGVVLSILLFVGVKFYYTNTESGKRAYKDQESNLKGGISRTVDVYDMEGDLIKSYSGEFDVEMNDTHIVFDDENGKRHIVYFTTGTVVIDEN